MKIDSIKIQETNILPIINKMEMYLHPLVSPDRVNYLLLNASYEGQR